MHVYPQAANAAVQAMNNFDTIHTCTNTHTYTNLLIANAHMYVHTQAADAAVQAMNNFDLVGRKLKVQLKK